MSRKAIESFIQGGVDSRSNPINEPASRFLYCRNFVPKLDGELDLRDGYSILNQAKTLGITIGTQDLRVGGDITPTLALGAYYFQVAPVYNGNELGVSKVFGPVTLSSVTLLGVNYTRVPLITFSPDQVADSYNIYFGSTATSLTQVLNTSTPEYALAFTGNATVTPANPVIPIHSQLPYTTGTGIRYFLYWQDRTPLALRISDMTTFLLPVRGTQVDSSDRFTYAPARNGHLLAFNGSENAKKWFDGRLWRDVGLGTIDTTTTEFQAAHVVAGVREITPAEAVAVSVVASAGGTFPADTVGRKVYVSFIASDWIGNIGPDEVGPSTIFVGSGPVKMGTNQKLTISNLPAGASQPYFKLISLTDDGGNFAYFATNTSTAVADITGVTIHAPGHGFTGPGDIVIVSGNSEPAYNATPTHIMTIVDADHFIVAHRTWVGLGTGTGGTVKRVITIQPVTSSVTITAPTVDRSYVTNQDRGLAPAVAETTTKGYQFALSIYNRTGGGHVGNWVPFGDRVIPTTRSNYHFTDVNVLVDLLGDTELEILVGRTGDGGEVPSVIEDLAGNWLSIPPNDFTTTIIDQSGIDGNAEMPTRNGIPPAFDKVWREADKVCGITANSPSVYRCGSEADDVNGLFVGLPEQSWAPNDLETFPTADHVICGAGYNQESWCFSDSDLAILQDNIGELLWSGPYNSSAAGRFAFTRGWQNQPYWVSKDKQLLTASADGPVPVSDEYEAALLSQIGDAYLDQTEVLYFRDAPRKMDILIIKCRDANGKAFLVIHDFILRDERSPMGQGYEFWFQGPLSNDFTLSSVRDANGKGQIWAGCSDGNLYQLFSGGNDAGTEFTADAVALVYGGPYNQAINQIEWYGDSNLKFYYSPDTSIPFDINKLTLLSDEAGARPVPGEESNAHYVVDVAGKATSPEFTHAYLWARLVSHSADGNMNLSSPPHFPLETYGRIYGLVPLAGQARGK